MKQRPCSIQCSQASLFQRLGFHVRLQDFPNHQTMVADFKGVHYPAFEETQRLLDDRRPHVPRYPGSQPRGGELVEVAPGSASALQQLTKQVL